MPFQGLSRSFVRVSCDVFRDSSRHFFRESLGVAPEIFPGISSDILSGIHPGMFFSGFLQESVGIRPEISSITPSGFFF